MPYSPRRVSYLLSFSDFIVNSKSNKADQVPRLYICLHPTANISASKYKKKHINPTTFYSIVDKCLSDLLSHS